jgi:hypothetical protein
MLARLACLVRGGHRWDTVTDAAGQLTMCARCGALRHATTTSVEEASFRVHTDVAADYSRSSIHRRDSRSETASPERPSDRT